MNSPRLDIALCKHMFIIIIIIIIIIILVCHEGIENIRVACVVHGVEPTASRCCCYLVTFVLII